MKAQKKFMIGLILSALILFPLIQTGCKKEKKEEPPKQEAGSTVALTVPAEGVWVAYKLHDEKLDDQAKQDLKKELLVTLIKSLIKDEKGQALADQIGALHSAIVESLKGMKATINNDGTCTVNIASIDFSGKWNAIEHGISIKLDPKDPASLPAEVQKNKTALLMFNLMTAENLPLKSKTGTDLVLSIESKKIFDAYMKTDEFKKLELTPTQVLALAALNGSLGDKGMKSFDITFKKQE